MKATLEFNLPKETYEFELAARASAVQGRVEDALEHIRTRLKHEDLSEDVRTALIKVRAFLLLDVD